MLFFPTIGLAWILSVLSQAVLALSLLVRRLPYPWACCWLFASVARSIALKAMGPPNSWPYFWTFAASDPLLLLLLSAATYEVFRQRTSGYRMLRRTGQILLFVPLLLAASLAAASLSIDAVERPSVVVTLLRLRQVALVILLVFTAVVVLILRAYPPPNRRNLVRHHVALLIYLSLAATQAVLFPALERAWAGSLNTAALVLSAICYAGWALALNRAGETEPKSVPLTEPFERAAEEWSGAIGQTVNAAKRARETR